VFSKTDLYEKVWQEDYVDDTNTLNVHIHALRQEMAKHASVETPTIKTVWGLGYKIEKARGS
ncbi:MAG: helix-turn-helix domain-containing protein, partial [Streptococcus mitis]|nr:helix-turn-helix domain-containing protein [Streptococcus mitis]